MTKVLSVLSLSLLIPACQNLPPAFTAMSEEELIAYNEDKPLLQKVHCERQQTTSTRIRKRICRTVQDWVDHNQKAAMALDVLNSSPFYSFPGSSIGGGQRR